MSGVVLSDIGMTFPNGFTALEGIDVDILDGEFLALVGPSGSGKTTLLRAVAGFLTPTAGSIHIAGAEVATPGHAKAPEKRGLGMVFQQHAIWPHLSVGDNVGYSLKIAKKSRKEITARVDELLELVGLAGFTKRNPATLSGGQRQRVALARALAPAPSVLLLDEALSALDEPLRDQLRVELKDLTSRMGLTVIHVTHDRNEALALADRIAVLDQGRIVQLGTPFELVRNPATPFVARFLSDATVLDGELNDEGFKADTHPLAVGREQIVFAQETENAKGRGSLAVLPGDVELVDDPAGGAHVISALFGRTASDVIVQWQDLKLRCASPWQPKVNTQVTPKIKRAIFYPNCA
ncbi:MAG: ABC transporter ATP-binding protein [Actinomycetaceae bacterium]|nr:ABC transporter ATP-binding protein [Actinomycetaceae bacterium]